MKTIFLRKKNYRALGNIFDENKGNNKKAIKIIFKELSFLDDFFAENIVGLINSFEKFFQIKIENTPFCLLPQVDERLIKNEPSEKKKKFKICFSCRYNKRCGGFFAKEEAFLKNKIRPVKDLPREVMIEITPHCNFNCHFCFNQNSFAAKGRDLMLSLSGKYLRQIISAIAKSGVKIVRFTGGEPLLREDIWELMEFAKNKGLKVRLNTNGSLIKDRKTIKKLNQYVSSLLLPIESCSPEIEAKLTGVKDSLNQKIRAINLIRKYSDMTLRVGTVASAEVIKDIDKIFQLLIKQLMVDDWELYRPIPVKKNKNPLNKKDLKILVDKLFNFQQDTGRIFSIVNGLPFCAVDKRRTSLVSNGALSVDGHIRYAIDPRGYAKPDYYIDKNIGDPLKIEQCWQHPFMKKMRSLGYLPAQCRDCAYAYKCRGGSRFAAKKAFGSFFAPDPLANFKNKKNKR